jgi:SAM-dependent methyltransferase
VLAVDLDTEALEPLAQAQAYLQAVKADISDLDYPESFDLIHARFVLSHLANRDELVRKFVTWLRPGGYLVITDAYQLPTEASPHPIVARVFGAYVNYAQSGGMDLQWVRSVPSLLARAGLSEISHRGRTTYLGGGDSDRWAPLIEPFADALVNSGAITETDKIQFFTALQDPTVLDIPQIVLTVTGRKP